MSSIIQQPISKITCSICSKSFLRTEHLTRHFRTHTNEKPYLCDTCGKGFSRSDILARHKIAHQLDDTRKTTIQSSRTMFRACFQCATARVKCSGSTPCQRCITKEHDCRYPVVQNKKKPKVKRKLQVKETFRAYEGNQTSVIEPFDSRNTIVHPYLESWKGTQSVPQDFENVGCQIQSSHSQQNSAFADGPLMLETAFTGDSDYDSNPSNFQASQSEQFQSWMRESTEQLSPEYRKSDFSGLLLTPSCHSTSGSNQGFSNDHLAHSLVYWLPTYEASPSDSHFSFGNPQCNDDSFGSILERQRSLPFDQETVFSTEVLPEHQQHEIYKKYQSPAAIQTSFGTSLQSPNTFVSLPGKYHSPATSISPSLGSVYNYDGSEPVHLQTGNDYDPYLSVPYRVHVSSPARLPSPAASSSPSRSHHVENSNSHIKPYPSQQQQQPSAKHQLSASWSTTRSSSAPLPSPRTPSLPSPNHQARNKQFHIPIAVEKQVLEYPSPTSSAPLVPASLYALLMAQFKHYCLKQSQPFLSDYFPSAAVLELSVMLYKENFHPVFPLLESVDFGGNFSSGNDSRNEGEWSGSERMGNEETKDDHAALLLLAVCAIGITYLATDEAWSCSEAFSEFLRRLLFRAGAEASKSGAEGCVLNRDVTAEMLQLQARVLSMIAMLRSPNRLSVEQAYEGRAKLMSALRSDLLVDMRFSWTIGSNDCGVFEERLGEGKRRMACCAWWLDCMMAQQFGQ